jgi:hypothetical protein
VRPDRWESYQNSLRLGRRCDHADEVMNDTKALQLQEAGTGFIKVSEPAIRFGFSDFSVSLINSSGARFYLAKRLSEFALSSP